MVLRRSIVFPVTFFLLACAMVFFSGGCARAAQGGPADSRTQSEESRPSPGLHVMLTPTAGHTATGMLMFSDSPDGLRIAGRLTQLPPDRSLGFHIHQNGDCSAPDASSAGDHFNPAKMPHGDPTGDGHHAGDMMNLTTNSEGAADVDMTVDSLTLDSAATSNIRSRAVVVHARADDYTSQPAGNSGDRIACGVIGAAMTAHVAPATAGKAAPRS